MDHRVRPGDDEGVLVGRQLDEAPSMQGHDSMAAREPVAVLDGIGALVAEPGRAPLRLDALAAM